MADEERPGGADEPANEPGTEPGPADAGDGGESPGGTTAGASAIGDADEDVEGGDDTSDTEVMEAVLRRLAFGVLVVHYRARDVRLILDGATAIRVLTMYARRSQGNLADELRPGVSSPSAGWVVLDFDEVLAMSWLPGLPRRGPRAVVDPPALNPELGHAA